MPNNMLSQEEIDALLNGNYDEADEPHSLSDTEKDAIGEIGNISMGTAATTLSTLLGQKVVITTPKVEITTVDELQSKYTIPFVAVHVRYKLGLEGANLLVLNTDDVKIITDLMMGGNGTNIEREINEMDLSAISEAMNQMVGSSCTSLSEMFTNTIDIEPPSAFMINLHETGITIDSFKKDEAIVKVSFKMIIGDLIDSQIMQLLPLSFARTMTNKLLGQGDDLTEEIISTKKEVSNTKETISSQTNQSVKPKTSNNQYVNQDIEIHDVHSAVSKKTEQTQVNVRNLEFNQFEDVDLKSYNESIDMIQDIPIEITVELGRTTRKINEILDYGPGTIIELDKLLGEPLEIYANGKIIAKGEVVVIDDNFGVRITDIINPAKRISKN